MVTQYAMFDLSVDVSWTLERMHRQGADGGA